MDDVGLDICVDTATFDFTRFGTITGVIFVQYGASAFPEHGWSDFPAVILGWWMGGLSRLQSVDDVEEFNFMDGGFAIEARRIPGDMMHLRFINEQFIPSRVVAETDVTIAAWADAIRRAVQQVIGAFANAEPPEESGVQALKIGLSEMSSPHL